MKKEYFENIDRYKIKDDILDEIFDIEIDVEK